MEAMTPAELLVSTLMFDPTRVFTDYEELIDNIPIMIQLGYFEVVKLHYGKHWFYVKLKQLENYEFRYSMSNKISTPFKFSKGTRTVTIPYDHRIFQIITF